MEHLPLIIIVAFYLLVVFGLGYRGYRRTKSATDYLVAGRQMHPYVMAMSYGATFISTSAIVGFGGAAGLFGMGILWLTFLNIFAGIFIAFVFFGGRTRRMGHALDAHTFPELLGRRFKSKFIQMFSGLVIFFVMPLYTAAVMMGICRFFEAQVGVEYKYALFFFGIIVAFYVIMGGLKGVMYTDALQGTIMFVGMLALLILTYAKLGGVVKAHEALTAMAPEAKAILGPVGHQGWTAMPKFGSQFWWILVSTVIMGVGIGVLAQPQLAVRFMTVKSKRELNRAVLVGGVFILAMTGVAFVVGALTNVYFKETVGKISLVVAGKDPDKIIPMYIKDAMPIWFGGLFLVTLLAAAMSTVSSQFHAIGTSLGRDFCEQLSPGSKGSILVNRVGIFVAFILSVLLSYVLPIRFEATGTAIIARATAIFFGLCAAMFLPAYLGGLYSRGMSRAAAAWGMVAGFLASAFWLLFGHAKESSTLLICQKLFGKPSLVDGIKWKWIIWDQVDPLFIGLPIAVIVTLVVAAATKPLPEEHLKKCFPGK